MAESQIYLMVFKNEAEEWLGTEGALPWENFGALVLAVWSLYFSPDHPPASESPSQNVEFLELSKMYPVTELQKNFFY